MKFDSSKLLVWGAILVAVVMGVAQEVNKEWSIKRTGTPDMLRFTVRRFRPGNQWSSTQDVPRSRFHNLSIDTVEHGGAAKFEYVQDAGTLNCIGRFSWMGGSGNYTFVPNAAFTTELKNLGYMAPDQEEQFSMMMMGVGLDFARGVKEAGLRASTGQLIELRAHGITQDYIADMKRAGYRDLTAQDYIDLRDHGVKSEFLRDLKDYGYNLTARDVIQLQDHGVRASFLRDLKEAGYNLPAHEVTELQDHGVNSNEMREFKHYGLQPAASELTQLRDHGITPEYLRGLKDAGYGKLAANEVIQLHDHGVNSAFAEQARELGYNFSVEDLVRLHDHGVDGRYLKKLHDSGMPTLSAEQIEKLRTHGID